MDFDPQWRSPALWCLLAWLGVSVLAAIVGEYPTRSFWSTYWRMGGVVDLAHWTVYAIMVASMFRTPRHWKQLLITNTVVGGIVAAIGLGAYYWPTLVSPTLLHGAGPSSTMGSSFHMGVYLSLTIGFAVAFMLLDRSRKAWWVLLPIGLCTASLWLSASRGGLLALLLMAFVLAVGCLIVNRRQKYMMAALGIFASVVVGGVLLFAVIADWGSSSESNLILTRLSYITNPNDESIRQRTHAITVAVQTYIDNPVLGIGPENFIIAWGRYARYGWNDAETFDSAHSIPFEVIATTGTAGGLAYVSLGLAMLLAVARSIRNTQGNERLFAIAVGSVLIGYFALSIIAFSMVAFSFYFALLAGYCISGGFHHLPDRPSRNLKPHTWVLVGLLIIPALMYSLLQFNASIFLSADIAPQTDIRSIVYNERVLMAQFPPMSNERRFILLNNSAQPSAIPKHAKDLEIYISALDDDISRAIALEPNNWVWPYLAAVLYQEASKHDPNYIDDAHYYLTLLEQTSPRSDYTLRVLQRQIELEESSVTPDD